MTNHFFVPDPTEWGPVDDLYFGSDMYLDDECRSRIGLVSGGHTVWSASVVVYRPVVFIWAGRFTGCMEWASELPPSLTKEYEEYIGKIRDRHGLRRLLHQFLLERLVVSLASGENR